MKRKWLNYIIFSYLVDLLRLTQYDWKKFWEEMLDMLSKWQLYHNYIIQRYLKWQFMPLQINFLHPLIVVFLLKSKAQAMKFEFLTDIQNVAHRFADTYLFFFYIIIFSLLRMVPWEEKKLHLKCHHTFFKIHWEHFLN